MPSPEKEPNSSENAESKLKLPLILDHEACALGEFAVLNRDYEFIRCFDTYEELLEYIATANGSDVETVIEENTKRAQWLNAAREKMREARIKSARFKKE